MGEVASRALRNDTRGVLRRVEQGERVTITVDGRPVATIQSIESRPRWMPRTEFASVVLTQQADPGLSQELADLLPDRTDDLPQ